MQTQKFSIGEMLKLGWEKFKEHPFTWIGALLLMFLISAIHPFVNNWLLGHGFTLDDQNAFYEPMNHQQKTIFFLVSAIYSLVELGLGLGLAYMGLRAVDGASLNIFHLFSRFQYVFHYLIAHILFTLMMFVGFILLVFPAAIWASRYCLYPYFIVDKGLGPIKSLKASSAATYGAKWDVFSFILTSLCLFILGLLAIILGLFVVIPLIVIAWAGVYRRLSSQATQLVVSEPKPLVTTPNGNGNQNIRK